MISLDLLSISILDTCRRVLRAVRRRSKTPQPDLAALAASMPDRPPPRRLVTLYTQCAAGDIHHLRRIVAAIDPESAIGTGAARDSASGYYAREGESLAIYIRTYRAEDMIRALPGARVYNA